MTSKRLLNGIFWFPIPALLVSLSLSANESSECVPLNEVSEEERVRGTRFLDNILEFEMNHGSRNIKLTRAGALSIDSQPAQTSNSLKSLAKRNHEYSSILYGDWLLVRSGQTTLEGFISQIDTIQLKSAKHFSTFPTCTNQKDSFFKNEGRLYYYCNFHCLSGQIHRLNEKTGTFESIHSSELCSQADQMKEIEPHRAKVKRKLDKTGREYRSSFIPLNICDNSK